MKKPTTLAAMILALGAKAFGLNPIHEGSYTLWPRGVAHVDWRGEGGAIFHGDGGALAIPLGLGFKPAPRLELGFGIKTFWSAGSDQNRIPFIPLGLKYQMNGATALNLDFFLATRGGNNGLRLGIISRTGHGRRLSSRFSGQLGFFDAFADGAAMAMEGEWTPEFQLMRGISLECGLVTSSQTSGFRRHFALDIQPGLFVGLWGDGGVLTSVSIGLAGDHREDLSVKIALARGF